jgi:hypothetical protein
LVLLGELASAIRINMLEGIIENVNILVPDLRLRYVGDEYLLALVLILPLFLFKDDVVRIWTCESPLR